LVNVVVRFKETDGQAARLVGLVVILLLPFAIAKVGSTVDPDRWTGMMTRLSLGLEGDAVRVNCEGVEVLRTKLEREDRVITPEISQALRSIQDGDGARMMAARTAIALSWANPMGIDQSRDAYRIALSQVCEPRIALSHAHNGWIDTALAIGIPGAILYLLVLMQFAVAAVRKIRIGDKDRPFAIALFVTTVIWILRSVVDSAQRNQMLEMQVFTIALLYGLIVSDNRHRLEARQSATRGGDPE
jgi:hypothetical protein